MPGRAVEPRSIVQPCTWRSCLPPMQEPCQGRLLANWTPSTPVGAASAAAFGSPPMSKPPGLPGRRHRLVARTMRTMGGAVRERVQGTARRTERFVIRASWFVIVASGVFVTLVILTKLQ
jgi:hypothetical protein